MVDNNPIGPSIRPAIPWGDRGILGCSKKISKWLGSILLFHLFIHVVNMGDITSLILVFDPKFQQDIQVAIIIAHILSMENSG